MATFVESQDAALHDDFDPTKYRTWAKRFLNEAIGIIHRNTSLARGDYALTAALSAGTASASLGSTEHVVIQAVSRADTGEELVFLPRVEFEQLENQYGSTTGPPLYYTLAWSELNGAHRLEFLPVPDRAYSLDILGRYSPAHMTLDGSTVPLPVDYQWLPVRYARAKLFALEDDEQMAAFWMQEWLQGLGALRADVNRRHDGPRVIGSMWEGIGSGPRFHHPDGLW
jgi:hypothetical protein